MRLSLTPLLPICMALVPAAPAGAQEQAPPRRRGLEQRLVYRLDFGSLARPPRARDRREMAEEMASILERRLEKAGWSGCRVEPKARGRIEVRVPDLALKEAGRLKGILEERGLLYFRILVDPVDDLGLAGEVDKFRAWRQEHPEGPATWFNLVDEKDGGPRAGVLWFPIAPKALEAGRVPPAGPGLKAAPVRDEDVLRQPPAAAPSWRFDAVDVESASTTVDARGKVAVFFRLKEDRREAFGDFTEHFTKRPLAIVLNDQILTAPVIANRLPGEGMILGGREGFEPQEAERLVIALETGSLRIPLVLEEETRVRR